MTGYYRKLNEIFRNIKDSLTSIHLTKIKIENGSNLINEFEECNNLSNFTIDESSIQELLLYPQLCIQTMKLKIKSSPNLSDHLIKSLLINIPFLTELDLTDCKQYSGYIDYSLYLPYLSHLNLSNCPRVKSSALLLLQILPLESLNLSFNIEQSLSFKYMSDYCVLNTKKLVINNRSFSSKDDFLKQIQMVKNLEYLEICGKIDFELNRIVMNVLGTKMKDLKKIKCSLGEFEKNERGLFKEV